MLWTGQTPTDIVSVRGTVRLEEFHAFRGEGHADCPYHSHHYRPPNDCGRLGDGCNWVGCAPPAVYLHDGRSDLFVDQYFSWYSNSSLRVAACFCCGAPSKAKDSPRRRRFQNDISEKRMTLCSFASQPFPSLH